MLTAKRKEEEMRKSKRNPEPEPEPKAVNIPFLRFPRIYLIAVIAKPTSGAFSKGMGVAVRDVGALLLCAM